MDRMLFFVKIRRLLLSTLRGKAAVCMQSLCYQATDSGVRLYMAESPRSLGVGSMKPMGIVRLVN